MPDFGCCYACFSLGLFSLSDLFCISRSVNRCHSRARAALLWSALASISAPTANATSIPPAPIANAKSPKPINFAPTAPRNWGRKQKVLRHQDCRRKSMLSNVCNSMKVRGSVPLDRQGYGISAAEAESGDASFQIAALQLVEKSDQNARAAGADRMADGDCSAIDVHFLGIEFQLARDGNCSDGKRFVQFYEINVLVAFPAGFLQKFFDRIDRRHHHPLRFDAADRLRDDASHWLFAEVCSVAFAGHDQRRRAVVGAGSISRGDRPVLFESGFQFCQRFE